MPPGAEAVDEAFRQWRRSAVFSAAASIGASLITVALAPGAVASVGLLALGVGAMAGTLTGWLNARLQSPPQTRGTSLEIILETASDRRSAAGLVLADAGGARAEPHAA
jgi:hypothetical protein